MPRKPKLSLKNKLSAAARWANIRPDPNPPADGLLTPAPSPRPTCTLQDFEVPLHEEEPLPDLDDEESEADEQPYSKPTGFALYSSYNNTVVEDNSAPQYMLVDSRLLTNFVCQFCCPECGESSLFVSNHNTKGYATVMCFTCRSCGKDFNFDSSTRVAPETNPSKKSTRASFDVNRRMVSAFTYLGKHHRALETFSMFLNMKPMTLLAFYYHKNRLCEAVQRNVNKSLEEARYEVRKACLQLDDIDNPEKVLDLCVSYDGSWHKRGFTSKYGVGCCIEVTTGLVIDYEVLSKFCKLCEEKKVLLGDHSEEFEIWYEHHRPICNSNYEGSSPAMEMIAAERIWRRSQSHNFRYTTVVSDGDAKAFAHLHDIQIYEGIELQKIECLNHVAKRLGTALRKLVTENRKSDEPLGGRQHGSLSAPVIDKLTAYYRNAVQNNLGSVSDMKKAIFATLDHCSSTDENPKHDKCPIGSESWCFFQRAVANGVVPEPHSKMIKTPLADHVIRKVQPIYSRLTSNSLLEKCVTGKTQNANEALHQVIWSKCPKTVFVSKKTVEMAVGQAICEYNTGRLKSVSEMQRESGISPGRFTVSVAKKIDLKRLQLAKKRKETTFQEYRKKKRQAILREEERKINEEGATYGAGQF